MVSLFRYQKHFHGFCKTFNMDELVHHLQTSVKTVPFSDFVSKRFE